jgi:hypothetical protein
MQSGMDMMKDESYIVYLDANNLYGHSMSQYLPIKGFKWLTNEEIEEIDEEWIDNISDESDTGYILEVDLDYPDNLHDLHNAYPFCIEKKKVSRTCKKLVGTLYNKRNYIIHYRNLKQAIDHGLKLKTVHKVISFQQEPWLKPYIDKNTAKRMKATTDSAKNMYKFFNNVIFGKSCENVEKHIDVRLCTTWSPRPGTRQLSASKLVAMPNFNSVSILDENFVAVQMNKLSVELDRPIYVGFSVLELSKTLMYSFHYDYMLPTFEQENLNLLYSDTDSMIYQVKNVDFYETIKPDINDWFDTSGTQSRISTIILM